MGLTMYGHPEGQTSAPSSGPLVLGTLTKLSYVPSMFQTDIHRWLQSFGTPFLDLLMRGISIAGEEEFLALIMLAVIFGSERRRGFLLTQVLLWTAIVTAILKDTLALPRPVDVDAAVRDVAGERNVPTPYNGRGATGFLDVLPADVVAYFRSMPHLSFGFPSGHCSTTIGVSGSAAILWRKPWLLFTTAALMVLMPLSRMYLGRHFLADVLGGVVLGLLAVLVVIMIQRDAPTARPPGFIRVLNVIALFALPALCIILFPGAPADEAAMLVGVNLGEAWTDRMLPQPVRPAGRWTRILHVAIALIAFIAFVAGLRALVHMIPGIGVAGNTASRLLAPCGAIVLASWIIDNLGRGKRSIP